MKPHILSSIQYEPLFAKSKVYISKSLCAKKRNDYDEYQLWASLALELLGKATLSRIHPCLIVDPNGELSLLVSCGYTLKTDVKTITAKTLFSRLRHISSKFDGQIEEFCNAISLRRNAELHSGETPFRSMNLESWEGHYWHCAQTILDIMNKNIEDWLGESQSNDPKQIINNARDFISKAAKHRFDSAKINFSRLPKKEREKKLAESKSKNAYEYKNLFKFLGDYEWEIECPACSGKAYLSGIKLEETIIESIDHSPMDEELVEEFYVAEEFNCPACNLRLYNTTEINALGIESEHYRQVQRERIYEPYYGND